MNGRLAYASLFSVAALVAVSSALLSAVSCTTNEIPTNDGSGDDDDASSDADLAFDGDPNTSLVTTISPYTCADAQSYVCTNASGDLAAATCNNGTFACPTGYTVLPVMTFSGADANATVGGCGGTASNGKALGICHDYTTCAEYGLIDVDKGAVQACEDDSICCTTVCPAGLCELLDGGGSFSPSCAAGDENAHLPGECASRGGGCGQRGGRRCGGGCDVRRGRRRFGLSAPAHGRTIGGLIRSSSSLAAVLSVSSLFVALSVTSAACSSSSSDTGFSSDSGAAKTCAGEGFSCTAVSACAASLGHLVGDPTAAASCGGSSSVCCSLGATSCGGAETFSCAMGSQTARPVCTGGFLQCATGYSQVDAPSADGGSTTNACTTVGGTCTSVSACSSGGVIVGDDGAAAACGSTADSVCCTTTCNGDPGMVCVVTEDGGDSETLNQECVMGQLTCPAGVATAADAGH